LLRISLIPLCILASAALGADELLDYLKKYEGRWVGDFTIHSTATNYSETFPVEQRYWWEDGELRGMSVADTNRGLQTSASRTYIEAGRLRSEVVTGTTIETYVGMLHDGGIVWLSSNLNRAEDYQMREVFVDLEGQRRLHTDGFDRYIYQEGLAHLVYRGRLAFAPESD
jgi:hypothetical protein